MCGVWELFCQISTMLFHCNQTFHISVNYFMVLMTIVSGVIPPTLISDRIYCASCGTRNRFCFCSCSNGVVAYPIFLPVFQIFAFSHIEMTFSFAIQKWATFVTETGYINICIFLEYFPLFTVEIWNKNNFLDITIIFKV